MRAAAGRLGELGIEVVDVDLPWHSHAMHVWNVIATDGATVQMVDGEGYGHNYWGLYDPELIDFYGRTRREVADRWSPTVTMVALAGRWSAQTQHTRHYAMARNLAYALDFAKPDLSVPTLPLVMDPGPHFCASPDTGMALEESQWLPLRDYVGRSGWRHVL